MGGIGSGRKAETANTIKGKEYLQRLDSKAVNIIEHNFKVAETKIEADTRYDSYLAPGVISDAIWVYEQNHGKAKQAIDVKSEHTYTFDAEFLAQLAELQKQQKLAELKLLGMDDPAISVDFTSEELT